MAMRALLRCTASNAWRSRAAASSAKMGQSDLNSSIIPPSLSESLQSVSFSPTTSPLCGFKLPRSLGLSGPGNAWIASLVPSSFFSASSFALASRPGSLRTSTVCLADLKSEKACAGAQQLGADCPALSTPMQQRRSLSKLKKYKMKSYSSYTERFKLMADGTYKRWRSGTRHNAHSKTPKQRRQLRRPSIAPLALAKVMKKLNFIR